MSVRPFVLDVPPPVLCLSVLLLSVLSLSVRLWCPSLLLFLIDWPGWLYLSGGRHFRCAVFLSTAQDGRHQSDGLQGQRCGLHSSWRRRLGFRAQIGRVSSNGNRSVFVLYVMVCFDFLRCVMGLFNFIFLCTIWLLFLFVVDFISDCGSFL